MRSLESRTENATSPEEAFGQLLDEYFQEGPSAFEDELSIIRSFHDNVTDAAEEFKGDLHQIHAEIEANKQNFTEMYYAAEDEYQEAVEEWQDSV